ncbi:hypothetical protein [Endozoicomonas elysicola]|uniref:Uncharacterized protein n=1 Tax=Endozoicomonas elysicola TaxID=305900 RepID=A0A081K9P5_9GAMM|nr:hypothetical protein [Endozoicomonas elysicola]KEI70871.1 hypothetical protein GV64_09035 [Endozoicomonas elysicola]
MNQFIKTVILNAILTLATFPLTATGEDSTLPIETSEHQFSYFGATGYTLEKHSDAPPVITIHFDHCIGSTLAREKRMAKGILIGNDRVLAPADYFIDPCSPPIVLPEKASQTSNNYFCHDQRIKNISHLSLIPENKPEPEPESDTEDDEARQQARLATPRIIRVLNELNFDGTSTVDALLCHKIENGVINPKPTVAVLSLSKRGAATIPTDISTATIAESNLDAEGDYAASSSLLLRNQMHFYNEETEAEPDSDNITQLIDTARQLQLVEENNGNQKFDAQPVALITLINGQHHLKALINDWELISEFPSLYDLPDYAQRHPYVSKLWKGTSPISGTLSHTLGMKSIPGMTGAAGGLLATVEIVTTATVIYVIGNWITSSSPYVYTAIKFGLGLILAKGFYRWATTDY